MVVSLTYKPTVSAIVLSSFGKVLLTHNKSHGPDFWKLPQGGVEPGESKENAIKREMFEELGTNDLKFIKQCKTVHKYEWPKEVQEKKGFVGPELSFFLLKCPDGVILKPDQDELDQIKWVELKSLSNYFTTLPELQKVLQSLISEIENVQ
jgi:putative (di)nucleoside polyphosphate hydrolase